MDAGRKRADDNTPAALYLHCVNVYNRMLQEARVVTDVGDGSEPMVVWEGMLTALITSKMNLSVPYYTHVTRSLKKMGCIRQLKRGGGTAPSLWELITDPTPELFAELDNNPTQQARKTTDRFSLLQQQVIDQNRRLLVLERAFEKIIEEAVNE